jgi:endonuclease/exonuclease/phosphatase family metal-dependent hydrolase
MPPAADRAVTAAAAAPTRVSRSAARAVRDTSRAMAGSMRLLTLCALAGASVGGGACRDLSNERPDAAPDSATGYPAPRDSLVPAIGSDATFDLATWNIELFPKDPSTAALAADLITSMRLDVIVVEEVTDEAAWRELEARLPEHDAVLSSHVYSASEYQKLGVLYRRGLVEVGPLQLLFSGDTRPFPRPPIKLHVTVDDRVHAPLELDLVGVHLKAGVTADDRDRRREALIKLDTYLRAQVDGGGEDDVVVLGDFNEVVTDAAGQATLAPLLGAPDRYTWQTAAYAQSGGITYLGFGGRGLDHIVTTAGLATETAGAELTVPRLDRIFGGYEPLLSDHLPVALTLPLR